MGAARQKKALKDRTYSPRHNVLSPNNDVHEKAQARAARAAVQRRKSLLGLDMEMAEQGRKISYDEEDLLGRDQILDLFQNCIKLATENKINQRNTWELSLIDHLSEVIIGDAQEDIETNFQKASCTLEASVKIYSYRVDSVHSDTYKVLGGVNRTAADDGGANDGDGHEDDNDDGENQNKASMDAQRKITTSATLESSYDAINAKKIDVAFTVDPLFHQTSAQFDEGGAKALLLNTLSVYNGCAISFDSNEVPIKSMKAAAMNSAETSATIDLSCIRGDVERVMATMQVQTEISPAVTYIVSMLDDPYRAAAEAEIASKTSAAQVGSWLDDQVSVNEEIETGEVFDHALQDNSEEDPLPHSFESFAGMSPSSSGGGQEDIEDSMASGEVGDMEDDSETSEQTVNWIAASLGLPSKSNAWAGPDHWKYRKDNNNGQQSSESSIEITVKGTTKLKKEKFSLDFLKPPQIDMFSFAPHPNKKSLLLSQSRSTVSTILPEDCHYQAADLVRLYLQPSLMCINRKKGRGQTESLRRRGNDFEDSSFGVHWDEDDDGNCNFGAAVWGDDNLPSESGDLLNEYMLPQPRKVQKIEVKYDKMSKQVDVRVLKETLWERLQEMSSSEQDCTGQGVSFQSLVSRLPTDSATTAFNEISVQLCFICLLHLANEHNLRIQDCLNLDELQIHNIATGCLASES